MSEKQQTEPTPPLTLTAAEQAREDAAAMAAYLAARDAWRAAESEVEAKKAELEKSLKPLIENATRLHAAYRIAKAAKAGAEARLEIQKIRERQERNQTKLANLLAQQQALLAKLSAPVDVTHGAKV